MKVSYYVMYVLGVLIASTASAQQAPKVNVQLAMLSKVNPQGLALWDITNNAMDDEGKLDPKKLTVENWSKLMEIGASLEQAGKILATGKEIIAAAPGVKLQDESDSGGFKASDVQRFIDAKPDLFRQHALQLQKTGTDVIAAAKTHNGKKMGDLADSLDSVCEGCHQNFWYPQQK